MEGIPPGVQASIAKLLSRTLGKPAAAVLDNFITGPLERRDAKKRAQADVDLRVINVVGDKMVDAVENLTPQQLAQLTELSSHRSILKHRNLHNVVQLALEQLTKENIQEQSEPVSDEFLDTFEPIAENQSTKNMQALFARILSGEIQNPGSFSKRSLRVAEQLDKSTAALFQRLCSMALVREGSLMMTSEGVIRLVTDIQRPYDKIVCSLGVLATNNSLESFGLNFTNLNRLAEYGLAIPSITVRQSFDESIVNDERETVQYPIQYQGRNWVLKKIKASKRTSNVFMLQGVGFSMIGHELFKVVDKRPVPEFDLKLIDFLRSEGFLMVALNIAD